MSDPRAVLPPDAPRSTYRLQFHREFTFCDALAIVDYLADLGITHVYASPILAARPGSTHGYDIVDHNRLNPEIGSPEEFDALVAALHARGLGLVLDVVPNHMGVGGKDNAWWLDVLEWGEDSPYAPFFDIDWKTNRRGLRGKVLVPVLGDQYGKVLANGEIKLAFDPEAGAISAWYYDHRLPIDPRDYARILDGIGDGAPENLRQLADEFRALKTDRSAEVHARGAALKRALAELAAWKPEAATHLAGAAARFHGRAGDLDSWLGLHALLEAQSYRSSYWRVAADEINYRRFFNINDLAGVRVELRELFEETHRLIFRLVEDGKVQGLRIDHIDGLFDPRQYLERVQARAGRPGRPAYVVVEKILAPHEALPSEWPIAGTSGYATLNLVNGVFVDPAGEARLDRFYRRYTGRTESFDEVLYASKKRIMQSNLASEMNVLANELHRLSSSWLPTRDFTLRGIRDAIEEIFAHYPVYRTYVTPETGASAQDRRYIDWAVARAKKMTRAADTTVFDFLRTVLTADLTRDAGHKPDDVFRVAMRVQQISGPVMAKGMEDTAFYRSFRLLSLNEVGGDPRRFGVSLGAFHAVNRERLAHWPADMLASSTHDTKRGEDARARINVLSEIPTEWARQVLAWSRLNRSRRTDGGEGTGPMPEPNHEYLYYQALLGAWPLDGDPTDAAGMGAFAERLDAFMQKAVREGKERSSWGNPDEVYERALSQFVRRTLEVSSTNPFPGEFAAFVDRVARWGAVNSLGQTLLKLTIPGIPDTYRGSELWDLSLVDPDNRRPVDYAVRTRLLAQLSQLFGDDDTPERRRDGLAEFAEHWRDGREKLFLIRTVLRLRNRYPTLFATGEYVPLAVAGAAADHLCAFARQDGDRRAVVLVPRFVATLAARAPARPWAETTVTFAPARYRDLFSAEAMACSGAPVEVEALLKDFPVALLLAE